MFNLHNAEYYGSTMPLAHVAVKKKLTHTFKERACIDYLVIKYDRQVTSIVTLTEIAGHVHYLLACHKESC